MRAPALQKPRYDELRERLDSDVAISEAELASMQRTAMERFYRQPISRELIELDDQGKFRGQLEMFRYLTEDASIATIASIVGPDLGRKSKFVASIPQRALAVIRLLERTPYLRRIKKPAHSDRYQFDPTVSVEEANVSNFVTYMQGNKAQIENLLEIEVGQQLVDKPMRVLGNVLKRAGIKQVKRCTRKVGGKKIYQYQLGLKSLITVQRVHDARKAIAGWDFVHSLHGWPKAERDPDEERPELDEAA